jgi:hypothetical protein
MDPPEPPLDFNRDLPTSADDVAALRKLRARGVTRGRPFEL